MAHLQELRDRLLRCFLATLVGSVVGWIFSESLFHFLADPLLAVLPEHQKSLQFTALTEVFMVYLEVGLLGGVVLAMPVIVDQIWKFIAPALYQHEKRLALPLILAVLVFFLVGLAFAYFISPFMFGYFASFQNDYLRIDIRVGDFFDFYLRFLLIFGVIFELPVFICGLAYLGLVQTKTLSAYRRHVIVGIFIAAAVITPTADILNQLLVAVPMYVLYELSIIGSRFVPVRQTQTLKEESKSHAS